MNYSIADTHTLQGHVYLDNKGVLFSRYRDGELYSFPNDPVATRDITVDFKVRPTSDAIDSIINICSDYLVVLKLQDAYEKEELIARTYRMFLQKEGTFTGEELQELMDKIEKDIQSKGHTVRC